MTVEERIKERRIELGLSQEELARKLGYKHRTSVNKIEMGKQQLTTKQVKAIADALQTTPAYLVGWEEEEENYYIEEEAKSLAQFLKDNPEHRILFDASRKVKKEDLSKALKAVNIFIDD